MRTDAYSKTIALATAPVNLIASSGAQPIYARDIFIRCPSTNISDLLIGNVTRQGFTIPKGTTINLSEVNRAGQSGKYELSTIFIKAGTNNDVVEILLIDPSTGNDF